MRVQPAAPATRREAVRLALWWLTAGALATGLAAHFTLVLLHVLPPNPVSAAFRGVTRAWVVPRFAQDWRLFAPTPVVNDCTAYARALYDDGDGEHVTEWLDFSTPVVRAVQRNRLSPRNAVLPMLFTAMYDVTNRAGPRDGLLRQRLLEEWSDVARQPPSLVVLEASGSAALAAAHPDRAFRHVQVMIAIQPPLPFAERNAPEDERPQAAYLVLPRVPFQPVAAWGAGR